MIFGTFIETPRVIEALGGKLRDKKLFVAYAHARPTTRENPTDKVLVFTRSRDNNTTKAALFSD
ncbi:MAG: hypothetical protein OXE94_03155 [Aestuariivita sp.]|nr:hypothetical protein [Aestuariivita sp.]MCY4201216.1 hypothetical protein [Aestuariivita sp.]MCY4288994.1 hypothetical protein [Aestuariivita sp.]MCY4346583.1 hypothetical protein [Aestuariivita sp.]